MTTYQSLYYECKEEWSDMRDDIAQRVKVHCRQWSNDDACDTIIEKQVIVDGEAVHELESYTGYAYGDAYYIRKAIALFDELLAAHPVLATATVTATSGGNGSGDETEEGEE